MNSQNDEHTRYNVYNYSGTYTCPCPDFAQKAGDVNISSLKVLCEEIAADENMPII